MFIFPFCIHGIQCRGALEKDTWSVFCFREREEWNKLATPPHVRGRELTQHVAGMRGMRRAGLGMVQAGGEGEGEGGRGVGIVRC